MTRLRVSDVEGISKAILLGKDFETRGSLYGYSTPDGGYDVSSHGVTIARYDKDAVNPVWNSFRQRLEWRQIPGGKWYLITDPPDKVKRHLGVIKEALAPALLERD